jgi:glycosyltransferase involved in cell wall biosynthesis
VLTVTAQTAYPHRAPGARVRLAELAPFLARFGVDLDYRPTLSDSQYETVVEGNRTVSKLGPLVGSLVRTARRGDADSSDLVLVHRFRSLVSVPLLEFSQRTDVYDFDDAIFAGSGPGTGTFSGALKAEAGRWERYVAEARLVVAGNEYLASAARRRARRVEVVPSCMDPNRYRVRQHRETSPVTIGWIGSRSTTRFLEPVLPVLERLNRDRLRARLVVVGGGPLPVIPWLEQRPWSFDREASDLAAFDIGIMPLPDTPWTRGKCGYKVLQYFAAGVPAIASPVGVNCRLIGADRGQLAGSAAEWYTALLELSADAAARRQMGEAGRRLVETSYSYSRWAPELAAMLKSLSA